MAENSAIEWTDNTFNPWIGCTKVGPGCDHCYAEVLATNRLGVPWGPGQPRRRTRPSNWRGPVIWNEKIGAVGKRLKVFCASLADVFDNEAPEGAREDLWRLMEETPNLDWQIVTKRIGNAAKMVPPAWLEKWPANVWLLITVVNQDEANRDIPKLLALKGRAGIRVAGLSMEPLQNPVDLTRIHSGGDYFNALSGQQPSIPIMLEGAAKGPAELYLPAPRLDWVIVGGESGPKARPMHPDWVRSIRDQCAAADVPFLFKQWGEHLPDEIGPHDARSIHFPPGHVEFIRCGKKAAGRKLEGVEHNGFPRSM